MFLEHMREMAGILAVASVVSEITKHVNEDKPSLNRQARDVDMAQPSPPPMNLG